MKNQYRTRLKAVKNEMAQLNLDALIIPHEDEYLLEEVSEHNNRLKWLTGFSGTAGVVESLHRLTNFHMRWRAIAQADSKYI